MGSQIDLFEAAHQLARRYVFGGLGFWDALDALGDRGLPGGSRAQPPLPRRGGRAPAGGEAQGLRDQCALACLTRIGDILTAYEAAPTLLEKEAIDDRAVDLWLPLIALTLVGDAEQEGDRTVRLLSLARDLAGVRDADQEAGTAARLLEALEKIREEHGERLSPTELLQALKGRPGWEWLKSPKRLASLLHPLGLFAGSRKVGGKVLRAYELTPERLADLRARYAPPSAATEAAE